MALLPMTLSKFEGISRSQAVTFKRGSVLTRSSAMAEGLRDALVSIEKLAIDE